MSAHQNQRQRLQEVSDAFLTLSSGRVMPRREIFGGPREPWHSRLIERLMEEELVIRRNDDTGNMQDIAYQAVDEGWFENIAADDVRLAEWYFKRGIVPEASSVLREVERTEKIELHHTPPPADPEEPPEQPPSGADPLQQKILDTLVLCAQNLVYLRDRVDELHAKVDALIGSPEDLV